MRQMSSEGLDRLTKPWEEFCAYPYDDKVPKRRGADGKLAYPEWTGGAVRGTITIGYGHTDAAGPVLHYGPKILPGMRLTEAEAFQLLLNDMAPCEARVTELLKVPATQHQYDALCDLDFNCPSAEGTPRAVGHVMSLVNAGNWPAAERVMLQYVYSKGDRMPGLVNRRNAEIAWANTPDDPEEAAATIIAPKADRAPEPSSSQAAASGWATVMGGLTAVGTALGQAVDSLRPLFADPRTVAIVVLIIVATAGFVWFERRQRLRSDHV